MREVGCRPARVIFVAGDGCSNRYKGVQLLTVYVMIALMFYLLPEASAGP
jgi:hypothetical protein